MQKAQVIAFYLPQFHPFKENDEWWGKGYTEWISVARARSLFPGHEQPKLPGELGFYDLRLPETREAQAQLAREYGIDGFCYYYYRLGKGQNLMDRPLKEVLSSGKPDFPFMLCWANHSWMAKSWNNADKGKVSGKMLIEQQYGDEQDIRDYFYEVLPYFQDPRYIKEDGCPLFVIYKPLDVPNIEKYLQIWNELAKANGLAGVKIIAYTEESKFETDKIFAKGFTKMISCRMYATMHNHSQVWRYINGGLRKLFKVPKILRYKNVIREMVTDEAQEERIVPTIMPNWDHSPRSGRWGIMWVGSTPQLFKKHVLEVFGKIQHKDNKMVFIKSWNEWGEGNYMEPDRKWQRAYLEAFLSARKEMNI